MTSDVAADAVMDLAGNAEGFAAVASDHQSLDHQSLDHQSLDNRGLDDGVLGFLRDRLHTDTVGHTGRTLFDHLLGTHDLLRRWGNPQPVCLAGLCHSLYGTQHFLHRAQPIADRAVVQEVIGVAAEALVYVFCVTSRPQAFLDAAARCGEHDERIALPDQHAGGLLSVTRAQFHALLEIEAANLLEQGGLIGTYVRRLVGLPVSPAARRALLATLRPAPVRH